ncbi:MAG: diguanylate cyclase [Defluviitaleaceae bacterium]|nr:diguanylate cyclase [Defluviitaleaceae bacterium]
MHNSITIAIYVPFMLVSIYVLISGIMHCARRTYSIMLVLMSGSIVLWNATMIAALLIENAEVNIFVWDAVIVFVNLATTANFLFVYKTFRPKSKFIKPVTVLTITFTLINAVICISPWAFLMRRTEIIAVYPVREVVYELGPWFFAHSAYSYMLAIMLIWILIKGHVSKPKFYRLSSTIMICGVTATAVGSILAISGIAPVNMDLTVVAASTATLFFHFATLTGDHNLFSRYARGKVFDFVEDLVLILGRDGHITDCNPSASRWFSSVEIDWRTVTLESVLNTLEEKGAVIIDMPEGEGQDISFVNGGFPIVLNMRVHNMIDEKMYKHGSVAFLSDVTQNRALLHRLEKEAGLDSLTGLPNRIAYDGAKLRYDKPEHLPLSVIMCDVNYLKETNDTLGHKYGDMLLRTISKILNNECKKGNFVARIGGDEFIFLLSQTDLSEANSLIDKVQAAAASYENLPFRMSLAMGAATKHTEIDCIDETVALSDSIMYQNKKQIKGLK